jgi:hypothetical protein
VGEFPPKIWSTCCAVFEVMLDARAAALNGAAFFLVLYLKYPAKISVVPLKRDLAYLSYLPTVETVGYFHPSG